MTRRVRANGEGSVYEANGRWATAVWETASSGEKKRRVLYSRTEKEAKAKLKGAQARIDMGAPVRDARLPLSAFLESWLDNSLTFTPKGKVRADSTKKLYRIIVETRLIPQLGNIQLNKLRPFHIERFLTDLHDAKLSDKTVRQYYSVLRLALDTAVRDGLLARNPAAAIARPTAAEKEARWLRREEVARLLKAAEGSRYHTLLLFISRTGVRKGEALALRWDDVDLGAGRCRIRGTKTERSKRPIPLGSSLVFALEVHRDLQELERTAAGSAWNDNNLVFATQSGRPVGGRDVLRIVKDAAEAANLDGVCVHTLRHSAASTWSRGGMSNVAISRLLGHADAGFTQKVYLHVADDELDEAAEIMEQAHDL